jgi:hypothetical protein
MRLLPSLLLTALLFLTGCQSRSAYSSCPPFPYMSAESRNQLEQACPIGQCEATFEWLGRLEKFKRQCEVKP